ncbi:MAG TPA: ABC transporter permease [Vicinamibacterales bacterium]|nr:ABC transporter permease [Vicinamibacterales bacterium]
MALVPLVAMVRKDLQLFFSDRRSVIMSFLVPIAIASFFGSIFSGPSRNAEPARIAVSIVDQDDSPISRGIVASAQTDRNLKLTLPGEADAREAVRRGKTVVAVVIPKGFGEAAGAAFFSDGEKPPLGVLYDPSHAMELAMVRGVMTEHVMEAVSREMFGGDQGRALIEKTLPQVQSATMPDDRKRLLLEMLGSVQKFYNQTPGTSGATTARGITMPYTVREEAITAGSNVAYNGYAHSFAGMGIQFLLFAMANLGVEMLLERQRGLWKRLRSAPVSRVTLLTAKAVSGAIISLMTLWVSFAFAMIVFRVRIEGSVLGFVGISLGVALMAASFGLLVAALGNTPASARGVTSFAILIMVMLGGAWVPTFVFPAWLQQFTLIVPVRWAVDGFDAMTWRGIGLGGAATPIMVLVAFATAFMLIAATRFRWEEA